MDRGISLCFKQFVGKELAQGGLSAGRGAPNKYQQAISCKLNESLYKGLTKGNAGGDLGYTAISEIYASLSMLNELLSGLSRRGPSVGIAFLGSYKRFF